MAVLAHWWCVLVSITGMLDEPAELAAVTGMLPKLAACTGMLAELPEDYKDMGKQAGTAPEPSNRQVPMNTTAQQL